jgi:4-amino-4-deoxy-L-arabinose transferase-like glycosyltransferase
MTLLKILILLLFPFCVAGAAHSGGFFGVLEWALIWELFTRGNGQGLFVLLILIPQVLGVIAIAKSHNRLMMVIALYFSLIVAIATFISREAGIFLAGNLAFLTVVGIYVVKNIPENRTNGSLNKN